MIRGGVPPLRLRQVVALGGMSVRPRILASARTSSMHAWCSLATPFIFRCSPSFIRIRSSQTKSSGLSFTCRPSSHLISSICLVAFGMALVIVRRSPRLIRAFAIFQVSIGLPFSSG